MTMIKTEDKYYLDLLTITWFKNSDNKKGVTPSVITKLKNSVSGRQNHIFYNYLWYLIIGCKISVKNEIQYVNNVFQYITNNQVYTDSFAWSCYKDYKYKKAKMKIDEISPVKNNIRNQIKAIDNR